MGLLNARNLRKAKELLEKNRHKVGDAVEKAGGQLDKVSKGKTSAVTSKAADAARKYSEGGVTHHGIDTPPQSDVDAQAQHMSSSDAQVRQAQAATGAANAVKGAADALTNLMNKAAEKAEAANAANQNATGRQASPDDIRKDEFD